jgi:hypothetical protein
MLRLISVVVVLTVAWSALAWLVAELVVTP